MKRVCKASINILLAAVLAVGLTACGGSGSGAGTTSGTSAQKTDGSWALLTVNSGNHQVTLSWDEPASATTASSTTAPAVTTPADTFNIYFATTPGVKKNGTAVSKIANVTSPYVHTGLTNGATYYYVVTKVSPAGVEGAESYEASVTPQASPPAAPAGLKVTAADSQITLGLVDSKGADITAPPAGTLYTIWWSNADTVAPNATGASQIANVTLPYTHSGLTNGTEYFYVVTAQTVNGLSPASNRVSARPQAAAALAAVPAVFAFGNLSTVTSPVQFPGAAKLKAYAANQMTAVAWDAVPSTALPTNGFGVKRFTGTTTPFVTMSNSNTKKMYNIYWASAPIKADKSNATLVASLPFDSTSPAFSHTALTNGQTCYYAVTVAAIPDPANADLIALHLTADQFNSLPKFEGPVMIQASVIPSPTVSAVPSNLAAAAGNQQVALSWQKDTSGLPVYYNVYAATKAPAKPADLVSDANRVAGVTSNSYVHSGLTTGTTHYYVVTSVAEAESAPSAVVAVTP